jgi:hypothetical protein
VLEALECIAQLLDSSRCLAARGSCGSSQLVVSSIGLQRLDQRFDGHRTTRFASALPHGRERSAMSARRAGDLARLFAEEQRR